jgi:excisionase family DNA binding protein
LKWRGYAVAGIAVAAPIGTITRAMQNQGTTPKQYLNIDRAAEYCGVSTKTLRRAVRSRRLAFFRPGRAYMFLTQDLDAFMNAARFGVVVFGKAA